MPALTILHLYSVHSNILTHNTILLRPHLIQPLLFFPTSFSPAHIEKFMSSFPMFPPFYCVHVLSRSSGLLCVHYCKGEMCTRDNFMALPHPASHFHSSSAYSQCYLGLQGCDTDSKTLLSPPSTDKAGFTDLGRELHCVYKVNYLAVRLTIHLLKRSIFFFYEAFHCLGSSIL